ncbi:hypothetical protein ACSTLM_00415, partial [Vibrio parahaemolyticus]
SWRATPKPPTGSIPTSGYDLPALSKPFYQPATRGTNYWDPEGDPMPWLRVGQFSLAFGDYDSSAVSATVLLNDSGQIVGPSGTIVTNPAKQI